MTEDITPFFSYPEDGTTKTVSDGVTEINFSNGVVRLAGGSIEEMLTSLEETGEEFIRSLYISCSQDITIQLDDNPKIALAAGQWVMRSIGFKILRIITTTSTDIFVNASTSPTNIIDVRAGMSITIDKIDVNLSTRASESTLGDVKTAVETIDDFISGNRGLVTEDNSAAIKAAVEVMDDWDDNDKCRVQEQFSGAFYSKNFTAPDAASEAPIESASKKLRDVTIRNTDANYEAELRKSGGDWVELPANTSIGFTYVDLNTVYVKAQTDGENPVLDIWGTEV